MDNTEVRYFSFMKKTEVLNMYQKYLLILLVLLLCSCLPMEKLQNDGYHTQKEWRCDPLPNAFEETDLVGTWQANPNGSASIDKLVVREDHKYKQEFINNNTGYKFESGWNEWWIEEKISGGKYIHFEGMQNCIFKETCSLPQEKDFFDYCENSWVTMEKEFVLAIVGDSQALRGFRLRHMRPVGWESFFVNYYLVEVES